MGKRFQNRDPREILVRYKTQCRKCGKTLNIGVPAFYWPAESALYCSDCGAADYKAFLSSVCDEEVYRGVGNPYAC